MIAEEQEILDWFERGELRSASEADREHEVALQAAHNTLADWFERGELHSASEADREHEVALQAAHNTLADWFERGELHSASEADREHEVALQAAHNTYPHNTLDELLEALARRLKIIAEFLKGRIVSPLAREVPAAIPPTRQPAYSAGSKYSLWPVPAAMAMILAIVVYYPGDKDYEEFKSILAKSTDRQQELVMASSAHATDKIRLLVGTEERIKEDGFPETDHRWIFLAIGERLDLKGQELKVLIGLSGELKKGSDYRVEKSQGTTFIIFTNKILSGEAVLAVVEAKN